MRKLTAVFGLIAGLCNAAICYPDGAIAQIIPDSSFDSQVSGTGNNLIIQGGVQRDRNLFHSFSEFSLPRGAAEFQNSANVQNIITRVRGNNPSAINGIIKANGTANLYFLNPKGIIFGNNARLSLGGSFWAIAGKSLTFSDGSIFQVDSDSPILSTGGVTGVNLQPSDGKIQVDNQGHELSSRFGLPVSRISSDGGLSVLPTRSLVLAGGEISLNGAIVTAPSGKIELIAPGKITLTKQTLLNATGLGGGDIRLQAKDIQIDAGSVVLLQNFGDGADGKISLTGDRSININGADPNARIVAGIFSEALRGGKSADIEMRSPKINIQDGALVSSRSYSRGQSGGIKIQTDVLNLLGVSPRDGLTISSINALNFGSAPAGNIDIQATDINIEGGARLVSTSVGTGRGGDVFINATGTVQIIGIEPRSLQRSSISASTIRSGDAGDLRLDVGKLVIKDGGVVDSSTAASGNGGSLTVNAEEGIELSGTVPSATLPTALTSSALKADPILKRVFSLPDFPTGSAGKIDINTQNLTVKDNATVSVKNDGTGNAGTLFINAPKIFLTSGGSITAATASGNGGKISIKSSDFMLQNASITVTAGNRGNGGNINIDTDALVLSDSTITANAFQGNGGNIGIDAGIFLQRNSEVAASSELGVDGTVAIDQIISPNSAFGITPATQIADRKVVTTRCSLSSPKFYIRGSDRVPALPDSLEFNPAPDPNIEANTMITKPDGTRALVYVSPRAFGHPDPCSN